jgi:hypothetical protein
LKARVRRNAEKIQSSDSVNSKKKAVPLQAMGALGGEEVQLLLILDLGDNSGSKKFKPGDGGACYETGLGRSLASVAVGLFSHLV